MNLLGKAFRELHFAVTHETGAFREFVTEPDNQEQRNADIGRSDRSPVNGISKKRLIILPQGDDQTQHEGEDRPDRKETRAVWQIIQ